VIFNYGIFPQIETSLAAEGSPCWRSPPGGTSRKPPSASAVRPGQYAAVRSFLEDPEAWSKARAAPRR